MMRTVSVLSLIGLLALLASGCARGPQARPMGPGAGLVPFSGGEARKISSHAAMGESAFWVPVDWPTVLADLEGPGVVTRIWLSLTPIDPESVPRDLLLRRYWDGEEDPSVEVPAGDFFGSPFGFDLPADGPLFATTRNAYTSSWQMPFERSARIELVNQGFRAFALSYEIDHLTDVKLPRDVATFHAQWRRENPVPAGEDFIALQARGQGLFAGATLAAQGAYRWRDGFLRGPAVLAIDGKHAEFSIDVPSYFGMGWFSNGGEIVRPESVLIESNAFESRYIASRVHLSGPIPFERSIGLGFEHGVAYNGQKVDYAATTFWYQREPHAPFPPMAPADERLPSKPKDLFRIPGAIEAEDSMPGALWEMTTYPEDVSGFLAVAGKYDETFFDEGAIFEFDAMIDGPYEIGASFVRNASGGIFAAEVDGRRIGNPYDTWTSQSLTGPRDCVNPGSGPVIFGSIALKRGRHQLAIVPAGRNPEAQPSWLPRGEMYDEIWPPGLLVLDCVIVRGPDPGILMEAEYLRQVLCTAGSTEIQQSGRWSGDRQLWWRDGDAGDLLELRIDIPETGVYDLAGQFTQARDYGIIQVEIDGQPVGRPLDLYTSGKVRTTGPVTIGSLPIPFGKHRLGFRIAGKNPQSKDTMAGIDYLLFHPANRCSRPGYPPRP